MTSRLAVKLTLLFLALDCCSVGAFQSLPYPPQLKQYKHIPTNVAGWKHRPKPSIYVITTTTTLLAANNDNKNNNNKDSQDDTSSLLDIIMEKPGTLIAAPFVVLVGLDLVANIFFMTKRTVEYFAFGKLPSTEVWFSDNFFL